MIIQRFRGDTHPEKILLRNAITLQIVDLTGCTNIQLSVSNRQNPTDGIYLIQLNGSAPAPATGVVEFPYTQPQADLLAPGIYYYDIQLLDAQGKKFTVVKSEYRIVQDINKS